TGEPRRLGAPGPRTISMRSDPGRRDARPLPRAEDPLAREFPSPALDDSGTAHAPKLRQLTFLRRGGKRKGAGRKPKCERALVPHLAREKLSRHHPLFVTVRLRAGLPSLRSAGELDVLYAAFQGCTSSADRLGLRLVHFTIQGNHLHFLVEARDARSLARGMQGLLVRIA